MSFVEIQKQKKNFKARWEAIMLEIFRFRFKKAGKIPKLPKQELIKKAPYLVEQISIEQFKIKKGKCRWAFFSGANGVGKNTLIKEVMEKIGALKLPYAYTRAKRPDEIEGIDYYFWNDQQFEQALKKKKFIWYDLHHHGKKQGLLKDDLFTKLKSNKNFVLDARVATVKFLIDNVPKIRQSEYISFYILPPSFDEWYRRLVTRSQEAPKEDIIERIEISLQEMRNSKNICEVFIVNDKIERAVSEILKFYRKS